MKRGPGNHWNPRKEGIPMSNDKNPGGLGYMGDLASQLYEDYIVQVAVALRFYICVKFPSTMGRAGPIFQFFFRHTFWSTPWIHSAHRILKQLFLHFDGQNLACWFLRFQRWKPTQH